MAKYYIAKLYAKSWSAGWMAEGRMSNYEATELTTNGLSIEHGAAKTFHASKSIASNFFSLLSMGY
jgi:hypothetical protein